MTRGSAPSGDAAIECGPPPGSVNPGGTGGVPGHANDGVAALASLWERCMLAFGTREQPVVRFGSPNDLAERIASALPISLDYCQVFPVSPSYCVPWRRTPVDGHVIPPWPPVGCRPRTRPLQSICSGPSRKSSPTASTPTTPGSSIKISQVLGPSTLSSSATAGRVTVYLLPVSTYPRR